MEFIDMMKKRRSRYQLTNASPISNERIEEIMKEVMTYTPSAFHSQSSRVILLLGEQHLKLWDIVKETLQSIVPENAFASTESKIDSFATGYGTILYFEDQDVIEKLQGDFSTYADNFPIWSQQSAGMLQHAMWVALAQEGLGASLQHYNPLIDEKVAHAFGALKNWKLIAQMPFGIAEGDDTALEYMPINDRMKVLGN